MECFQVFQNWPLHLEKMTFHPLLIYFLISYQFKPESLGFSYFFFPPVSTVIFLRWTLSFQKRSVAQYYLQSKVLILRHGLFWDRKILKISRFKARLRDFLSSLLPANYSSHILLLINPSEKTEMQACESSKSCFTYQNKSDSQKNLRVNFLQDTRQASFF